MKRTVGLAPKAASFGISLLMLLMSLAVPILERSEIVVGPVAESEHDPATCPTAHDHRICTQVGANLSAVSTDHEHRLAYAGVFASARPEAPIGTSLTISEGHPSRAPPQA